MRSERNVRKMSFADKENCRFFFEGCLGKLTKILMVEDMMLQVEGVNGTMRMDISKEELQSCLQNKQYTKAEAK